MDIYQQLITNAEFTGTVPALVPLPSISGASLYFENQSPYGFKVMDNGQSIEIDYIQPFGYLQMPYRAPLAIAIDKTVQSAQAQPFYYFGVKFTDGIFGYAKGSLVSQGITDVQGNMNATINGTVQANITNASLPISGNVGITSGSVNATIQNASISTQSTIVNPTNSPIYNQNVKGAYGTLQPFSGTGSGASSGISLIPAGVGGYIQSITINCNSTGAASSFRTLLYNGVQQVTGLVFANGQGTLSVPFGNGVVNNGITMSGDGGADTWGYSGSGVIVQNTPPGVVAQLQ